LEIGGPSPVFHKGKLIPVYNCCRQIDSSNFSDRTIWSSTVGGNGFGDRLGEQFVAEACNLSGIANGTYDFVLASHVLEHTANPLQALQEWKRVLTPRGIILVIVPDKRGTFDHRRPYTSFDHLEADYQANMSEDDLTHLDEILALHDLALDPAAGSWEEFRERCLRNSEVRAMHHHVFSPETLIRMFASLQMQILGVWIERPEHIVGFAQKIDESDSEKIRMRNLTFLNDARWKA